MKKQIALIIISLLAAMPANAQKNNIQNMCINPSTDSCEVRDNFFFDDCFKPNVLPDWNFELMWDGCNPQLPQLPQKPDVPVIPDSPEIPEVPEIPNIPEIPEEPEIPNIPETPDDQVTSWPTQGEISTLLVLVNNEREKNGIAALTYDSALEDCAKVRAAEIKTSFSHTRPDGTSCFTVLDERNYKYSMAGENIAYGQKDAYEVFEAWMNSKGHRENILNPSYTKIGMAVYGNTTLYWAQFFAS